jgi:hypothetical protein
MARAVSEVSEVSKNPSPSTLTREKNEATPAINRLPFSHPQRDAMAPAARTIQAQSSPETDNKWGWIIAVVLILAVVYWPLAIFAGLGAIPASIAVTKGHASFMWWWIYGAALFIVALPHALLSKGNKKQCNACKEYIHPEATVCPHCRNNPRAPSLTPSLSS